MVERGWCKAVERGVRAAERISFGNIVFELQRAAFVREKRSGGVWFRDMPEGNPL